jgi:hypothetical protein
MVTDRGAECPQARPLLGEQLFSRWMKVISSELVMVVTTMVVMCGPVDW